MTVNYLYICDECGHSETIARPTEPIVCSKYGAIAEGCLWIADSYEEYLKE